MNSPAHPHTISKSERKSTLICKHVISIVWLALLVVRPDRTKVCVCVWCSQLLIGAGRCRKVILVRWESLDPYKVLKKCVYLYCTASAESRHVGCVIIETVKKCLVIINEVNHLSMPGHFLVFCFFFFFPELSYMHSNTYSDFNISGFSISCQAEDIQV